MRDFPLGPPEPPSIISLSFTSVAIVRKAFSTLRSCLADVSKKCMLYSLAKFSPSSKETTYVAFRHIYKDDILPAVPACHTYFQSKFY